MWSSAQHLVEHFSNHGREMGFKSLSQYAEHASNSARFVPLRFGDTSPGIHNSHNGRLILDVLRWDGEGWVQGDFDIHRVTHELCVLRMTRGERRIVTYYVKSSCLRNMQW